MDETEEHIVWDQHVCALLEPGADLSGLREFRRHGATFVSLNVGMDAGELADVIRIIAGFRAWIDAHPDEFVTAETLADVMDARESGRLAVGLDLEGIGWIGEQVELIGILRRLGVRTMQLAYNQSNALASGCADEDTGLTELGRRAVAAMNAAGVVVDCTHTGRRATLEMIEASTAPVIFSHANAAAVWPHFRNIADEQIRACAATGGVVGINGVNWFLGATPSASAIVRHVEHVGELVGFDHVGLGLDHLFDVGDATKVISKWPELVNEELGPFAFAGPDVLPEVAAELRARGHGDEVVTKVMGANFARVAKAVWREGEVDRRESARVGGKR